MRLRPVRIIVVDTANQNVANEFAWLATYPTILRPICLRCRPAGTTSNRVQDGTERSDPHGIAVRIK